MFSLKNKRDQRGFTIVELLIVIVVIGILAALVLTTYGGIQSRARDSKRQTDIAALQTQLEAYFTAHNVYPTAAQLNSATFRSANMKGLQDGTLTDPSHKGTGVSVATSGDATKGTYVYDTSGDTSSTCTDTTTMTDDAGCSTYKISAFMEADGSQYSKSALSQ